MLSNIDVLRMLKQKFPELTFYPSLFPLNAPDDAGTIDIYSPSPLRSGLLNMVVTIKFRAKHPKDAEKKLLDIMSSIEGLSGEQLGDMNLLTVQSMNPIPRYLGVGVNGLYSYSMDFKFLLDVIR